MGKEAITKELEKRRIPELLRLSDNTPVDTPQLWETRRKEIRGMLQKECYGYIPESGWVTEWETVSEEENAFGGKARMRTVDVRIRSGRGYGIFIRSSMRMAFVLISLFLAIFVSSFFQYVLHTKLL